MSCQPQTALSLSRSPHLIEEVLQASAEPRRPRRRTQTRLFALFASRSSRTPASAMTAAEASEDDGQISSAAKGSRQPRQSSRARAAAYGERTGALGAASDGHRSQPSVARSSAMGDPLRRRGDRPTRVRCRFAPAPHRDSLRCASGSIMSGQGAGGANKDRCVAVLSSRSLMLVQDADRDHWR